MPRKCLLATVCALLFFGAQTVGAASIVASNDDAFVAHDSGTDVWSIGSRELELVVGFDRSGLLILQRLFNPLTERAWDITPAGDFTVMVGGEPIALSMRNGMTLTNVAADTTGDGVRLVFTFEHAALRLRIARAYACYPGSPTIETWTDISALDGSRSAQVTNAAGWQITMSPGTVKWLGGLRRDAVPGELESFEQTGRELEPNQTWEIGSTGRSTEKYIPLVLVDDAVDVFYGGVMWSGAWKMRGERVNDRLRMTALIQDLPAVAQGRPVSVPHMFFGLTTHEKASHSQALLNFFLRGIRHGRPFTPLVTLNTWFAYGTTITEDAAVAEIDRAAAMGVELFVVDAGWYTGAGTGGDSDFESGLGSFTAEPERFPSGLPSLADYAHNAGLKFGLWVEPERVAFGVMQTAGARQTWLAAQDGSFGSTTVGQICLASEAARQWLLDRLTQLIESVRPDYLKWDNNGWVNCNRPGHGHGSTDGNFSHVEGLYSLLGEIRKRFPDLLIENVSGGGNRLDFGLLGLTDAAWMDDQSAPSVHVRHNLEGLSFAFPPAYLLSFVIPGGGEELDSGNDLSNIVRSRMPGVLGMTIRTPTLDDAVTAHIAAEIRRYKAYREIVARASATLLSGQAPVDGGGWDVLQEVSDDAMSALVFAFKNDPSEGRVVVHLRGLKPEVIYKVGSADVGPLGAASGASLMQDGVELIHGDGSLAHVLVLRASE
jgi:alpha-galactosidase